MDVKERIKNLSTREKAIGAATLFVVLTLVPYFFLYAPSRQRLEAQEQTIHSLNSEILSLSSSLQVLLAEDVGGEALVISLPEASDLTGMLQTISGEARRAGADFISFKHEGFSYRGRFVEMNLRLELRASYRELHDFLNRMARKQRLFMVKSLRFETNRALYPSGVAIIKAVTYLDRG